MSGRNIEIYDNRPPLTQPLAIISIVFGILGIPTTLMLLISTLKLFRRPTLPHLKISLGILILDFIATSFSFIVGLSAVIDGEYLAESRWYCAGDDLFYGSGILISSWFVGLMSLERGLLVIHGISLSNFFWVSVMVIEVLYYFTMNIIEISFDEMGLANLAIYCMPTPDSLAGFITLNSYFIMMCLNVLFTIYSYIGIAIVQRQRAWKDIKELNVNKDEAPHQANRTVFKVLLLLGIYLSANTLELVNTTMEIITGETRSTTADFISLCLLNFNPIINSILLIQFHEQVKSSFIEAYPILFNW